MLHLRKTLRAAALALALGAALPAAASAATISGTVTAQAGGPAAGVAVELRDPQLGLVTSVCTAGDGSYAIPDRAPGTYSLLFGGAGCSGGGFAATWYGGFATAEFSTQVALGAGDRAGINAALKPEATISGTVRDAQSGLGVERVSVVVLTDEGEAGRACTGPGGAYVVRRLNDLPYAVQFAPDRTCGDVADYPSRFYRYLTPEGAATAGGATNVNGITGADEDGIDVTLTLLKRTLTTTVTGPGTVTSSVGAIACPGACTAALAPDTVVTLTPAPGAGSTFAGWTGACTGTAACTVTLDGDKTVGATFDAPDDDGTDPGGGTDPGTDPGGTDPGGGTPPGGGTTPGGQTTPGGGTTPGGATTPTGGTPPAPTATAPPQTAPAPAGASGDAPTPKPVCRIAKPSRVKGGRFTVRVTCDRPAALTLGGRVRIGKGRSVELTAARGTAARRTASFKLPKAASRARKAKRRLTVALRLTATTSAGTTTVTTGATRLR